MDVVPLMVSNARRRRPHAVSGRTSGENPMAVQLYATVARIRAAELILQRHIADHGFGGFWHPGLGQEGVQAGAVAALRSDDYMFLAHRGLGYALAKGMSLESLFGDLFGRANGSTGGKGGGTVHFCDPALGVLGQGGTLGSSFVLGAGAAISGQMLGTDRVCAIFFGDGAAARGTWHEAALQASVWKLPIVWVCENNGWAVSARFSEQSPTPNVADRASAYDVPGVVVDGQDALAVYEAVKTAVARARSGLGPTLIEAKTLRIRGHYEGDRQKYRDDITLGLDVPNDPIDLLRRDVPADVADALDEAARDEAETVLALVLASPRADPSIIYKDVWT